jgi:hypothetical protein
MEAAVRSRLIGNEAVAAIVGERVDWDEPTEAAQLREGEPAFPRIVLTIVFQRRPQHMTGFTALIDTIVQVDCQARTATEANDLRDAAIAAIAPSGVFAGVRFNRATNVTPRTLNERTDAGFIHRQSVEATLWHRTEN